MHGLGGSINPTPFLKTIEEDVNLFYTLPRERSPSNEELSSQEEDMEIPPSKEDQDLRSLIDDEVFPTIEEEEEKVGDYNTVMTRAHL